MMDKQHFKKGDLVIKEGEEGREMYFIVSGKVRVYKTINQEKIELGELSENNFVGEMNLFLGSKRSATVETVEDTEMMVTDKENLIRLMEKHPDKAVKIIQVLVKRIHNAHSIIKNIQGEKESLIAMYKQQE